LAVSVSQVKIVHDQFYKLVLVNLDDSVLGFFEKLDLDLNEHLGEVFIFTRVEWLEVRNFLLKCLWVHVAEWYGDSFVLMVFLVALLMMGAFRVLVLELVRLGRLLAVERSWSD
jgi:hypothetical protein